MYFCCKKKTLLFSSAVGMEVKTAMTQILNNVWTRQCPPQIKIRFGGIIFILKGKRIKYKVGLLFSLLGQGHPFHF